MSITVKTVSAADSKSIIQLKSLWIEAFGDNENATEAFFEGVFYCADAFAAFDGNTVVSALYLLRTELNGKKAYYLCGAATLKKYRKRGIMSRLIEYALSAAKKKGYEYLLLLPADESLYSYYSRFGFERKCRATKIMLSRQELLDITNGKGKEYLLAMMRDFINGQDSLIYDNKAVSLAAGYYREFGTCVVSNEDSLGFFEENGEVCSVIFFKCRDFAKLSLLLLNHSQCNSFEFVIPGNSKIGGSNVFEYGMIKPLNNKTQLPDNSFIGLTFE